MSIARDFSPRIEAHGSRLVTLDVSGLDRLLGPPRVVGEELRRTAADRRLGVHVAVSASRTTAALIAQGRAGLTIVAPGNEAQALAPLPLTLLIEGSVVSAVPPALDAAALVTTLKRWGLRTLGDFAALPAGPLSARLGAAGAVWQRVARGEDAGPLVPSMPDERFEASLDLEWPIDGLEPLSFVLGRLLDPVCARLEQRDRGAAALHVRLRLVTRETHERSLQWPAPIRDPRALRTLALLDLESHPAPAGVDRIAVAIDPTPSRVLQFSLLARARPSPERLTTLIARLSALMGENRVGGVGLLDSHRPGAFDMTAFTASVERSPNTSATRRSTAGGTISRGDATRALVDPGVVTSIARPSETPDPPAVTETDSAGLRQALRRFRRPIPARVSVEQGRPVRVATDRRGLAGGRVEICVGPWRTSGDWWRLPGTQQPLHSARAEGAAGGAHGRIDQAGAVPETDGAAWASDTTGGFGVRGSAMAAVRPSSAPAVRAERAVGRPTDFAWNRDEWDVALSDGVAYRLSCDRDLDRWFIDGIID